MKRTLITLVLLSLLLIPTSAFAQDAALDGLLDVLSKVEAKTVYVQSFKDGSSSLGLSADYPVYEIGQVAGRRIVLNANVLGTSGADGIHIGVGASATVENVISAMDVGLNYVSRKGVGWHVSIFRIGF